MTYNLSSPCVPCETPASLRSSSHVIASVCPQLPQQGKVRDAVLAEIRKDIEPFRGALAAAKLEPHQLVEDWDWSQLGSIVKHLQQLGQLQQLAEQRKIDPSLLDFDFNKAMKQPTLLKGLTALLKEAIRFIERNENVLESVGAKVAVEEADHLITSGAIKMDGYLHHFAERIILLDGRDRLTLTDPKGTHSLHEPAQSVMMRLFHNDVELDALRKYVFDAFQMHLAIDFTRMISSRFVLSNEHPGPHEKAIATEAAMAYFSKAEDIASKSDGLKSYVGLHATLLSQDYRIILLDEPEAFLHSPLARRLGFNLTKLAAERGATVISATHSPFFLMGCLEAGETVNVVRLGYHDRKAAARRLSADSLHRIMNDPLLRSSHMLDALFHHSAVVCEGDSDQAFYDEINERLRRKHDSGDKKERFARDCLFINTHGKDNLDRLMGMLRTMGIPAAVVVDLDVLQEDGKVATKLLKQASAAEAVWGGIGQMRSKIRGYFETCAKAQLEEDSKGKATDKEKVKNRTKTLIKRGGIDHLKDKKEKKALQSFRNLFKEHGIFIPPRGEVENWLEHLGKRDVAKELWLGEIFAAMGSLEDVSTYIEPGEGDVWDFMREIAEWIDQNFFNVTGPESGNSSPSASSSVQNDEQSEATE